MNLETKHPSLGDFVVHHSLRRGSGVPMDQTFEKEYNKKGPGDILGVTRQKESVAKWNMIKHKKRKFLDDLCDYEKLDEYSLHHEFSDETTKKNEEDIELIKNFIEARCDIMKSGKLSHIVTGAEIMMNLHIS